MIVWAMVGLVALLVAPRLFALVVANEIIGRFIQRLAWESTYRRPRVRRVERDQRGRVYPARIRMRDRW